jgi:hypothetical protein
MPAFLVWIYQLPFLLVLALDLMLGIFWIKGLVYFYPILAHGVKGRGAVQTTKYVLYLLVGVIFLAILGGHPALRNMYPTLVASAFGVLYFGFVDRYREPFKGMIQEEVNRRVRETLGKREDRRQA